MQLGTAEVLIRASTSQFDQGVDRAEKKTREFAAKAERETKKAQDAFTKFGDAVRDAANDAGQSLDNMSSRAGVLGTFLRGLGPAGLAAGAAIGAVSAAMHQGTMLAADYERQGMRLERLLRTTGAEAWTTADKLQRLAHSMDASTLANEAEVLDSMGALLSFRRVQGEVFEETIRLAQDLAEVMGGSLREHAIRLARALEDPIRGVSLLAQSGMTFSVSQREQIRQLVQSNRLFEAQSLIIAELSAQVGGAGEAAASGLTGKINSLSSAWRDLLRAMEQTSVMTGALDMLTDSLRTAERNVRGLRDGLTLGEKVQDATKNLENLNLHMRTLEAQAERTGRAVNAYSMERLRQQAAAVRVELARLQAQQLDRGEVAMAPDRYAGPAAGPAPIIDPDAEARNAKAVAEIRRQLSVRIRDLTHTEYEVRRAELDEYIEAIQVQDGYVMASAEQRAEIDRLLADYRKSSLADIASDEDEDRARRIREEQRQAREIRSIREGLTDKTLGLTEGEFAARRVGLEREIAGIRERDVYQAASAEERAAIEKALADYRQAMLAEIERAEKESLDRINEHARRSALERRSINEIMVGMYGGLGGWHGYDAQISAMHRQVEAIRQTTEYAEASAEERKRIEDDLADYIARKTEEIERNRRLYVAAGLRGIASDMATAMQGFGQLYANDANKKIRAMNDALEEEKQNLHASDTYRRASAEEQQAMDEALAEQQAQRRQELEAQRKSAQAEQEKWFRAYKAFKISEVTIATYEAATKAYASMAGIPYVGPALGVAAAAAAVAAGLANVALISQQQAPVVGYAMGGISHGPQLAMVSEGPYPSEAHVPLPDGRTIPVTVSGGGSPINIYQSNDFRGADASILPYLEQRLSRLQRETEGAVFDRIRRDPRARRAIRG